MDTHWATGNGDAFGRVKGKETAYESRINWTGKYGISDRPQLD